MSCPAQVLESRYHRVFDGRKLTILGYSRQCIPGNWKLVQENIKDHLITARPD
jgi:hypothetical protein